MANAGNVKPSVRLKDKETLFMLLALHMEESPLCENPIRQNRADKEKNITINKTGIVICDSDSIQRVMMMDCSREQLHAAQLVMMNLATRARGCNVYLSRKPCTDCAKCLVQGGVRSVIFWPKDPEYSLENKDTGEKDSYEVNQIFRISSTIATPHVPIIDS
ncbi:cytidine and dCMP deaminase domain-containing protein 1-like [Scyliorhinus torazame]|uniref:cytidine and dCMP deaminase domain-containing protein 1-like n=1 Tax=Scyliorhinus torazame TaxID=75743 RepID=UPI003B5A46C8